MPHAPTRTELSSRASLTMFLSRLPLALSVALVLGACDHRTEIDNVHDKTVFEAMKSCPKSDLSCIDYLNAAEARRLLAVQTQMRVHSEAQQQLYYSKTQEHLVATLWSQLVTKWFLLLTVIGISGAGIAMSWHQLNHALKKERPTGSTVELGEGSVKIESPIVGLIIFVSSIAFFSIYVTLVYPISFLGPPPSADARTSSSPAIVAPK